MNFKFFFRSCEKRLFITFNVVTIHVLLFKCLTPDKRLPSSMGTSAPLTSDLWEIERLGL